MTEQQLTTAESNWREKITELEALIAEIRPQLIDAEAQLAERLTVISAFEFKLRAQIKPLIRRLEKLQDEIQSYRQQLRRLRADYVFANGDNDGNGRHKYPFDPQMAAASGDYRYHEARLETPPFSLSENDTATLKQLYRQLARRFHPDLALDKADRAYRTRIMKAINAAYSAGDMARLQALAEEPDSTSRIEYAHTDEQLAQALTIELNRCRRRLAEIKEEMSRLERHKSTRLLRRTQRAATKGRDLLAEINRDLNDEVAHKLILRDVLKQQVEQFGQEEPGFSGDDFANTVFDLTFEGVFDGEETAVPPNWQEPSDWDDDILDDYV